MMSNAVIVNHLLTAEATKKRLVMHQTDDFSMCSAAYELVAFSDKAISYTLSYCWRSQGTLEMDASIFSMLHKSIRSILYFCLNLDII